MVTNLEKNKDKAAFVSVLVEGQTPAKPATAADLKTWAEQLKIPFTVVTDIDSLPFNVKKVWGKKETTFILDAKTLTILVKAPNAQTALKELDKLP